MHARKACLLTLAALFFLGALTLHAKDGATPKTALLPKLVLVPRARVEISPVFTTKDSFQVRFRLEAPAAEKYQRHRCLISANHKGFKLATPKVQQWMLRNDTLMVLSDVDLTLRAPRALASSLVLEFKFTNLDRPKQPSGTATLVIGQTTLAALKPQADSVAAKPVVAKVDSRIPPAVAASDSLEHGLVSDSTRAKAQAEESVDVMPWILIGLLLSGFAVMTMLSRLSRKQSREAMDKTVSMRPAEPLKNSRREEQSPVAFAQMMRRRETVAPLAEAGAHVEKEEKISNTNAAENAVPASSVLALTPRRMDEIIALPDLQSALAQLSAVTAEVQKAVGKQLDALQKLSTQVETARMLPAQASSLQNKPRIQFAFDSPEAAGTSTNSKGAPGLDDLGVRVSATPEAAEKYEEIADAIASLAAASKIKTPPVSAQALAPKIELLHRLQTDLATLAVFCRANATGVSAETVESVGRRVSDLRMSYEAWASDQTSKLPLMLQRPSNGSENARRKIVESLLDGLYETRKLAAQGGLYFERRLAQLLEQDVPKLRAQFSGNTDEKLQKILASMA